MNENFADLPVDIQLRYASGNPNDEWEWDFPAFAGLPLNVIGALANDDPLAAVVVRAKATGEILAATTAAQVAGWRQIYGECIAGYEAMDAAARIAAQQESDRLETDIRQAVAGLAPVAARRLAEPAA